MKTLFLILALLPIGCAERAADATDASRAAKETDSADIPLADPSFDNPVVAAAAFTPARVNPGQELTFVVRVRTAPTWHIYAMGKSQGPEAPTVLQLQLPPGIQPIGEWKCPQPAPNALGTREILEGDLEFRHRLIVAKDQKPARLEVSCEFAYQACDPFKCNPAADVLLKATVEVAGNQ